MAVASYVLNFSAPIQAITTTSAYRTHSRPAVATGCSAVPAVVAAGWVMRSMTGPFVEAIVRDQGWCRCGAGTRPGRQVTVGGCAGGERRPTVLIDVSRSIRSRAGPGLRPHQGFHLSQRPSCWPPLRLTTSARLGGGAPSRCWLTAGWRRRQPRSYILRGLRKNDAGPGMRTGPFRRCRFRPSAPARAAAWRTASAAAGGGCFCRWGIAAPADTRWTRPTWPGSPRSDTLRSTWTAATEPQADHPPPASGRYESIDSGSCTDPRHKPAYPQFRRLTSARVLHVFFTPAAEEIAWAQEGVPVVLGKLWSDIGCSQGKS